MDEIHPLHCSLGGPRPSDGMARHQMRSLIRRFVPPQFIKRQPLLHMRITRRGWRFKHMYNGLSKSHREEWGKQTEFGYKDFIPPFLSGKVRCRGMGNQIVNSFTPKASEIFAMVLKVKLCVPPSHLDTSASVFPIFLASCF